MWVKNNKTIYRTSTFRPNQSSCNLASTNRFVSFAFVTATSINFKISSVLSGTPPNFWRTHNSFWAFRAIDTNPALSRCSSWEGSIIGGVDASGKNAKVKQNGVWWMARGTGARSEGRCYMIFGVRIHYTWNRMHTTVTSSPITSTSGLRKCLRATIPAKHAQSRRLPASAKKCRVNRICHT